MLDFTSGVYDHVKCFFSVSSRWKNTHTHTNETKTQIQIKLSQDYKSLLPEKKKTSHKLTSYAGVWSCQFFCVCFQQMKKNTHTRNKTQIKLSQVCKSLLPDEQREKQTNKSQCSLVMEVYDPVKVLESFQQCDLVHVALYRHLVSKVQLDILQGQDLLAVLTDDLKHLHNRNALLVL